MVGPEEVILAWAGMDNVIVLYPRVIALNQTRVVTQEGEAEDYGEDDEPGHGQTVPDEPSEGIRPQPPLPPGCNLLRRFQP